MVDKESDKLLTVITAVLAGIAERHGMEITGPVPEGYL
jgi:hypothetical protein